jgi:predicted O-methyltransferase YrrM
MSPKTIQLDDRLHAYLLSVSLREPEVLADLRAETAKHPYAQMQIAPEQGQFMGLLVRLMGATRCLEVGVFTGYSSISVALALPPEGKVYALDVDPEATEVARRYWKRAGVDDRIELRLGDGTASLDALLAEGRAGTFDFAFIDADKEGYPAYYERSLELLRPGGLMAFDNVLRGGRVVDPNPKDEATEAIREFNRALHADARVDLSMVPIADGLTLALRRP